MRLNVQQLKLYWVQVNKLHPKKAVFGNINTLSKKKKKRRIPFMTIQTHFNSGWKRTLKKTVGDSALYSCLCFLGHLMITAQSPNKRCKSNISREGPHHETVLHSCIFILLSPLLHPKKASITSICMFP